LRCLRRTSTKQPFQLAHARATFHVVTIPTAPALFSTEKKRQQRMTSLVSLHIYLNMSSTRWSQNSSFYLSCS